MCTESPGDAPQAQLKVTPPGREPLTRGRPSPPRPNASPAEPMRYPCRDGLRLLQDLRRSLLDPPRQPRTRTMAAAPGDDEPPALRAWRSRNFGINGSASAHSSSGTSRNDN